MVRRGLRQVLAEGLRGCQLSEATTADEALARLEEGPCDLLLLDINLPGRSGLEVLQEVRTRWPGLRTLVLSAYPEEEFAVRCLKLGAAGYLAKSGAADELLVAARTVLEGGRFVSATLAARLSGLVTGSTAAPHEALSNRELQVLRLVAHGRTLKEIAAELGLSEKTVSTYRQRLAEKLNLSSNVEITRYAMRHGLAD